MNIQVLHLLSDVSAHGDAHLAEVERDLVQMDILLDEAIKKLCASFIAIHQAIELQQQTLNGMLLSERSWMECAPRLEAIHDEISRHIAEAVTGLQFQDMTSQLSRRMVLHLAGLRDVFGALDADASTLPESAHDALLGMLHDIRDRVGERCTELAGGVRSSVQQRHMASGDIELF